MALDNIFIERFFRSLKYEDIYLYKYSNIIEAKKGVAEYIEFYNSDSTSADIKPLALKTSACIYHSLWIILRRTKCIIRELKPSHKRRGLGQGGFAPLDPPKARNKYNYVIIKYLNNEIN